MAAPYPIEPGRLAQHALRLVADAAAGAPLADVAARRSVSASYYAVFHAVALGVAGHVAPVSEEATRFRLARSLDHGRLADVCRWVLRRAKAKQESEPVVDRLAAEPALAALATAILELQEERHGADYDHFAAVSAEAARDAHVTAVGALALLDELAGTPALAEFYALVALHSTLR